MKIGEKSLKLSSGKVIHFKSKKARDNYERAAQVYKHVPTKKLRRKK